MKSSVTIYTRPPKLFFKGSIVYYGKFIMRAILNKKRGPDAVLQSLVRGLRKSDISYQINTHSQQIETAHVLSNVEALRWAIKEKRNGHIKKLIAGPNIVILPTDYDSIMSNPAIDNILVTSDWTKKLYESFFPALVDKIVIWPAGVEIPEQSSETSTNKTFDCLLYKKDVPEEIYEHVVQNLISKNISFKEISYGWYTKKDYFLLLSQCKYMIYLQRVESQGIALQEAWARNVPTLVWNNGSFTYPNGHVVTGNISAPFLTNASGMFFSDATDFDTKLNSFISQLQNFTPRQYCIEYLSDEASVKTYAKILE